MSSAQGASNWTGAGDGFPPLDLHFYGELLNGVSSVVVEIDCGDVSWENIVEAIGT